jgi:hypothetical protein
MEQFSTLSFCHNTVNDYEDFINNKTIENLFILVKSYNDNVDLKLFYIQNKKLRYVSNNVFKLNKINELLRNVGFILIKKRYKHFDKDGNLMNNLFKPTLLGINKIVKIPLNMKNFAYKCLTIKKKQGKKNIQILRKHTSNIRKKKKKRGVKKSDSEISDIMDNINSDDKCEDTDDNISLNTIVDFDKTIVGKKRKRDNDKNIPNKKQKISRIDIILLELKDITLNMEDIKKIISIIFNDLNLIQKKEILDDIIDNNIILNDINKFKDLFINNVEIKKLFNI